MKCKQTAPKIYSYRLSYPFTSKKKGRKKNTLKLRMWDKYQTSHYLRKNNLVRRRLDEENGSTDITRQWPCKNKSPILKRVREEGKRGECGVVWGWRPDKGYCRVALLTLHSHKGGNLHGDTAWKGSLVVVQEENWLPCWLLQYRLLLQARRNFRGMSRIWTKKCKVCITTTRTRTRITIKNHNNTLE